MHDEFDPIGFHLIPCPIGVVGGLIFVSFSEAPPDLQSYLAGFAKELEFHDTKSASVALQSVVTANANWKLLVQNNLECYHCQPAHPTYWRAHPGLGERLPRRNPQIRDNELLTELASAQRTPRRFETCSATAASQFFQTIDSDVIGGHATTESVNGAPVARAMGHATFDGSLSFFASPVLTVTLNPDYSIIYSFVPRGIRRTDIEITWLVDPKSTQDPGFDLGKLTEVWATTLTEDKMLVESNQLGVESSAYRPGPYSTLERRLTAFDCWYLSRVPR
jgi:Rieske 2Fe-2S family protein